MLTIILHKSYKTLFDMHEYEVEFPDVSMDTYSANMIAENLVAQVNTENQQYQVISASFNHQTNGHAVSIDDVFIPDRSSNQHQHKATTANPMEGRYNILG
jgi:hypothetical protein